MVVSHLQDQDLGRESWLIAEQLRRAPRDRKEELKKQLPTLVNNHFEARQSRRAWQLKRLEVELERMKASTTKREEMKSQMIGRRVVESAGEDHEFNF